MYYLMIAEGGTEYGHMETIFRAAQPFGPYEPCPRNPILSHRDHQGSPIQATGHADLVEDQNGNWWLVCLGIRPIGHALLHNLGRETFLAPVTWDADGWPVVGNAGRIDPEMSAPLPAPPAPRGIDFEDSFHGDRLNLRWNFVRNPVRERYELTGDGLLLHGGGLLDADAPTLAVTRQQAFCVRAEAGMRVALGGSAGLAAYYNKDYFAAIRLAGEGTQRRVELVSRVHALSCVAASHAIDADEVEFAVSADRHRYTFSFRAGGDWTEMGGVSVAGLCTEATMDMTFTGAYLGVFCESGHALTTRFTLKQQPDDYRPAFF